MSHVMEIGMSALLVAGASSVNVENDRETVSRLDIAYQAAVKRNDPTTMDKILHPDFAMVRGDGQVVTRDAIMDAARTKAIIYRVQDEEPGTQAVRVWGDTAVVTALLHIVGDRNGELVKRRVWFSDTYVRTASGWRYAFAQVSLPLPE